MIAIFKYLDTGTHIDFFFIEIGFGMCRFPTKKIILGANIRKQSEGLERLLSG